MNVPPHPVTKQAPAAQTASRPSICKQRRFFQPIKQNAAASTEPGKNGLRSCSFAAVDVLLIVSTVDEALPVGVTAPEANVHCVPAGSPEQLNTTIVLNPFCGTTETTVVPGVPGATFKEVGDAEIEKSAARVGLMVYAAIATALLVNPLAPVIAWIVCDVKTEIGPL